MMDLTNLFCWSVSGSCGVAVVTEAASIAGSSTVDGGGVATRTADALVLWLPDVGRDTVTEPDRLLLADAENKAFTIKYT